MENKKLVRWPKLLLGVITLLFGGIIYAWSILKAPLTGAFHWNAGQLGLNYTLTICFFALGGFVSGMMSSKTSPRLRMIISAVCLFFGFFITSRLSGRSILPLYLGYGVLSGLGIGFLYNTVISVVNAWYPDRKGLCSGILMMAFGFSALILGNVADRMIRMSSVGWRATFLMLGLIGGAVVFISAFFIGFPPKGTGFPKAKNTAQVGNKQQHPVGKDFTGVEMVKRASFWKLFIFFILLASVGSVAISFAKDISIDVGAGSGFAVTVAGMLSVFNGLGRLASGSIFDNLGLRKTQYITSTVALVAPIAVLIALKSGSLALGVVGLCLCCFSYGFSPTFTAAVVSAFYGQKNFPLNFSLMNLVLIPASFSATLAGNLVNGSNSFVSTFIMLSIFSVAGLILNITIREA